MSNHRDGLVYFWRQNSSFEWIECGKKDYEEQVNRYGFQGRVLLSLEDIDDISKDLERYRWLRQQEAEHGVSVLNVGSWPQAATCIALTYPDSESVDRAIDEAMLEASKK